MKKIYIVCCIGLLLFSACKAGANQGQGTIEHEHVPDSADCARMQYCIECGEKLNDQGPHVYPEKANAEEDGYSYYRCRICGHVKIINHDGLPVVPVG